MPRQDEIGKTLQSGICLKQDNFRSGVDQRLLLWSAQALVSPIKIEIMKYFPLKLIFVSLMGIALNISYIKANDYFPLKIGNKWVYKYQKGMNRPGNILVHIIDTLRINNKLYYCYREVNEDNHEYFGNWREDSLKQIWSADKEKNKEYLSFIRFSDTLGTIYMEYDSLDNLTVHHTLIDTSRIVSTSAGVFNHCYCFLTEIIEIQNVFLDCYAPGIGLVERDFEPGGITLKGALINGILYGDTIVITSANDIKEEVLPSNFELFQNYPNPFNSSTIIKYQIKSSGFVEIKIYNYIGQKIDIILRKYHNPGIFFYKWEPKNLSSGVYLIYFKFNDYLDIKKVVFLR